MPDVYGMVVDAELKIQDFVRRIDEIKKGLDKCLSELSTAKDSMDYGYIRAVFHTDVEFVINPLAEEIENFGPELSAIKAQKFKDEERDLPIERGSVGYEVGQ